MSIAATAAVGILAGCAPSGDAGVDLPPKNVDAWVMPLDEFTYSASPLRDYAEALLERPCYTEYGISWDVPWQPLDRGLGQGMSTGGQRLFTAELASKYGYHRAPNEWQNKEEWKAFIEKGYSLSETAPNFDAALNDCRARSRSALPIPSDEDLNYAADASYQIQQEALLDERLAQPREAWRSCMNAAGVSQLTDDPESMPGDDLIALWQIGEPGTAAGPEEIRVATADADCSSSTGWTEALYNVNWEKQANFLRSNSDRLLRIREAFREDRKMLENAVSENPPA